MLPFSAIPAEAQSLYDAAELALFDHGDANTLLIPAEENAAQQVLSQGADVLVGPLLKENVASAAQPARQARVPVIAFSTDNKVAGDGVYLLSFPLEEEVSRVLAYASLQGDRRVAVLAPDDEYGRRVEATARRETERLGGVLVSSQFYARNELDAAGAAESLARRAQGGADAVLIAADNGALLRAIGPGLLRGQLDVRRVKLLGAGAAWSAGDAQREPTLAGGWYAAPDPVARAGFEGRYRGAYGRAPTRLASLAYDAVALSSLLTRDLGGAGATRASIERADGFIGADGVFRFRPDGTIQRALSVLEVRAGGAVVVSPAPKRFGGEGS